ncbi:hypothetical protein [aff. Roholtiella sp. LEGE 12411]|uniref:hypothetical protein n=1 Tax=aff. Roholtiella sp. LEGE 12411 TaxID=1828822 RepID=UPI00187E5194|nr:hypothetical protein [aff. Roholtiella sp. LEGE 12411]
MGKKLSMPYTLSTSAQSGGATIPLQTPGDGFSRRLHPFNMKFANVHKAECDVFSAVSLHLRNH